MTNNSDNDDNEHAARPSIAIRMIRHAESRNNQVYRDARRLFGSGTDNCDEEGWERYVEEHRRADPSLSDTGKQQAQFLADYLAKTYMKEESSNSVQVIVSPMLRTCETIQPTLARCKEKGFSFPKVLVNSFYFETEGCHTKEVAEEGMNPEQIRSVLLSEASNDTIQFEGFSDPNRGWWLEEGNETRSQAERRAAKFFLWLCEHLDAQLATGGIPDASIQPNHGRNVQLLIGHGDFMSLVLQRIITSFGHAVERSGVPHRSAFVHWNTGITELEYFGRGRFLLLRHNSTPHLTNNLMTGGSLQDGWSYLMSNGYHDLDVSTGQMHGFPQHVHEQRDALRSLYLKTSSRAEPMNSKSSSVFIEDQHHFIVKRGLQVVATATYCAHDNIVSDVALRPSGGSVAADALFRAVKEHANGQRLIVRPNGEESRNMLTSLGFASVAGDTESMEFVH